MLHDVFAVGFDTVAEVLGTTPAAARQLASRARRAVDDDGVPRHRADRAEQRRLVEAFLAASESGDLAELLRVLAPGVVLVGDGGGHFPSARRPILGAEAVARFVLGVFGPDGRYTGQVRFRRVLVDGTVGLYGEAPYSDGRTIRVVLSFAVHDGRITGVFNQLNPEKLAALPPL
ncbi:nuclear transport factor 2 family protein [Micromonospora echinospora]